MTRLSDLVEKELQVEIRRLGRSPSYGHTVAHLEKTLALVKGCPDEAVSRIARAAWQLYPTYFPELGHVARLGLRGAKEPLLPQFQKVTKIHQAYIVMGRKPTEILEGLTPREAHNALTLGYVMPIRYLLRDLPGGPGIVCRSVEVARWVVACHGDERWLALTRPTNNREEPEDENTTSYLLRTDELDSTDVPTLSTGVRAAFARADARIQAENALAQAEVEAGAKVAAPPDWWTPIRCARLLRTPEELSREGSEMHHCVGGYFSHVQSGRSVIIALQVPDRRYHSDIQAIERELPDMPDSMRRRLKTNSSYGKSKSTTAWHRSTVELDHAGELVQHRGPRNSFPHRLCERALMVCRKRWGLYFRVGAI